VPSRRTDAFGRRAVIAVAVPTALAGLAGALVMAPAHAADPSPTLPFPTSICGTSSPSQKASPSPSVTSRSPSATPKPSASASPQSASASPSASPSASGGTSAAGSAATPSPNTSTSSSGGGFWGWVNGVWTWIFGSAQVTHSSAPAVQAAAPRTTSSTSANKVLPAIVSRAAGPAKKAAVASAGSTSPAADPSCVPSSAVKNDPAASTGNVAAETPWHLSTPSMTMYNLTYNGIATIKTDTGSIQALDFTASKVTLVSMVTFSHQGGTKLQFVNGGQNQTVTLENVHLLTTSMTANVLGLLHLTFTPTSTPTALLGLLEGVTVPIPLLFTNVEADNAFLNTGSIVIPGFDGHGN